MKDIFSKQYPVLISGEGKLACSLAMNGLLAKQRVVVATPDPSAMRDQLSVHAEDVANWWAELVDVSAAIVAADLPQHTEFSMAIVITGEDLGEKRAAIARIENALPLNAIIAINTESILLKEIQHAAKNPARIIGANWVEPAHTTFFLEVIANDACDGELVELFMEEARRAWKKDPYLVRGEQGIRSRLLCAMIREAFHLVEEGYVTHEDIDRACRNDAGYYLPFAGNFRYMDLMGTFVYGIVMKDMNPDLSKNRHIPDFFTTMIKEGHTGLEAQHGFFEYGRKDPEKWNEIARNFSYQVREIIEKYHHIP